MLAALPVFAGGALLRDFPVARENIVRLGCLRYNRKINQNVVINALRPNMITHVGKSTVRPTFGRFDLFFFPHKIEPEPFSRGFGIYHCHEQIGRMQKIIVDAKELTFKANDKDISEEVQELNACTLGFLEDLLLSFELCEAQKEVDQLLRNMAATAATLEKTIRDSENSSRPL